MKKFYLLLACVMLSLISVYASKKYVGGDISLLTKYEEHGAIYYNENGTRISDMLSYLKATDLNAMRVRLFVDPSKASSEDKREGVCQDLPYVLSLSKRIKDSGFKLMLDIHYSDTWTDPAQHSTPSSWTVTQALADSVYEYTCRVLTAMTNMGATPDFIQVGNEVTYGMLWPTGHCYPSGADYGSGTFQAFVSYLEQGVRACREICPSAGVIIHTEMSRVTNVTSFYQTLNSYHVDYDIIGLSYYPYWHGDLTVLNNLLATLESTYPDKMIQIVETGYPHAYYPSSATYDLQEIWPATELGQKAYASDLIETLNGHRNVNGLYWWFPEANEYGIHYTNSVTSSWYNCGWWDNATGEVMDALFEMASFLDGSGDDPETPTDSASIYIVGGVGSWSLTQPLSKMTNLGNGTYVDTINVSQPIYFVFADGGPEVWQNDWTVFNGTHRYGPEATMTVVVGHRYVTAKRSNDYSYYFSGGGSDYCVTLDLDNLQFELEVLQAEPEILPGDVNEDGKVDVDDVTTLIAYVLGYSVAHFNAANADLDADETFSVSDVTRLISMVLSQK